MSNFDIVFESEHSDGEKDRINSFTLTFQQKSHDIAMGYYVIYPSINQKELILVPKHKFDSYKRRFEEISERIIRSEKETADGVKAKNRKYIVTEEEVREAKKLRSIISHSHIFKISGAETTIRLPGKYLEMLRIKEDCLTFVQSDTNEYLIINPDDAWEYSDSRNLNYSDSYSYDLSPKALFSKLKKAI